MPVHTNSSLHNSVRAGGSFLTLQGETKAAAMVEKHTEVTGGAEFDPRPPGSRACDTIPSLSSSLGALLVGVPGE